MRIIDDDFTVITDDIEKIQKKSTVYISFTGAEGVQHLAQEITNNIIDEHNNPKTISDGTAYIVYDSEMEILSFEDHGRGIPFEELENICTIIQSGSKMDRVDGDSAGENGIGLTVTNALSSLFMITSTRGGKKRFLKFVDGKLVEDRTQETNKDNHGLLVSFKPSKVFLGPDAVFPVERFKGWLAKLSYFMNPSLTIHFKVRQLDGKEDYTVYENTEGIGGFLAYVDSKADLLGPSPVLTNSMQLTESDVPVRVTDKRKKDYGQIVFQSFNRDLSVYLSLNYTSEDTDTKIWAFCNDIENIEGGVHQDAVASALGAVFLPLAKEALKKGETVEITQRDVLSGLRAVVCVNTNYSTKFTSQTKHKLGNKELYKPIRKLLVDSLSEFVKVLSNKKTASKIGEIVKTNAQIRLDVLEKKKRVKKSELSLLSSKLILGYDQANLVGRNKNNEELEIYIVEGKSAGDLVRIARFNNDIQGVLATFGKPPNLYGKTSAEVKADSLKKIKKSNGEMGGKDTAKFFHVLADDILGCGYGDHFDESKLIYDKIILGSDADIDGQHIMGINVGNFVKHTPKLITSGHVYRVIAPLYKIIAPSGYLGKILNKHAYIYSKRDLYDLFEQEVAKHVSLRVEGEEGLITPAQLRKYLQVNRNYYEILTTISERYKIDPDVIEFLVEHEEDFKKPGFLEKNLDKELHYKESTNTINGCYRKRFTHLILDGIVKNSLDELQRIYKQGNSSIMRLHYYRRAGRVSENAYVGYMTIGKIMEDVQQYAMKIVTRFKGYGEMSAEEMQELVMNPDNRVLIRLTMNDAMVAKETFDTLFLKKSSDKKKLLLKSAHLDPEDIDN